jgi:N-glycosylase/DNA lyase
MTYNWNYEKIVFYDLISYKLIASVHNRWKAFKQYFLEIRLFTLVMSF